MTFNTLIDADRLANLAISMLAEFTAARRGHMILCDEEGGVRHEFGLAAGESMEAIRLTEPTRKILLGLHGTDGARLSADGLALSMPLSAEETFVGALHLERDPGQPPFESQDRSLLEACATHLAQSLRSRHLYEAHLAQRRRVELLDRVTRAVNAPADLEDVLGMIIRTAAEALEATSGALILGDTAGRLGVATGYRLGVDVAQQDERPAEARMVRWVFTEGAPMCDGERLITPIRQVIRDRRVLQERRRSSRPAAFLRTLGVLYLEGPLKGNNFGEDDLLTLGVFADHVSAAIANNSLMQQASTDALTRLDSRRQLEARLQEEMEFARQNGIPLSVIMVDVDHFKKINDTHGHQAGDEVLVEVAAVLRETVRRNDQCARYGGEEFTVVLPETHLTGAQVVAENIRRRVENGLFTRERIPVTVSLGIAEFPLHASSADGLLRKADRALYDAKAAGRNRSRTANPL
jgi:diguanylate cyclase (GGDEF)-like protein